MEIWSPEKAYSFALWSCLHSNVPIKFGLKPDLRPDIQTKREFLSTIEDKIELVSSLQKFMQISSQSQVFM